MTAEMTIRRAEPGDLGAIVQLLANDPLGRDREGPLDPLDPAYRSAFDAIASDPGQLLAVGVRDGRVIATLQLSFLPGLSRRGAWRGLIEAVRVAGPERGAGLGRVLIDWAVAQCRARGCALVQLTSDASRHDAHRFYERLGFAPTHVGFKLALPTATPAETNE